ncbi:hypothetical protein KIN20_007704 [Parelaphostrongylus tenuis]|uniref:MTOR-associated protein MEAK7 n=1 Tax=Parelaphostrongylus tenuis TaxID=148309 RepID=A0AAD5M8G6_PARTN|nr:hypothetical protein KIN20_007704 [Parelaphostrongylus tenuis]
MVFFCASYLCNVNKLSSTHFCTCNVTLQITIRIFVLRSVIFFISNHSVSSFLMGAKTSTAAEKSQFVNLSADQLRRAEVEFRRCTKTKDLDYDQIVEIYSALQPAVPEIYKALQQDGRCSVSNILQLADSVLGDTASQAASLLKVFGTIQKALSGVVSIYAHQHELSTTESDALVDYFLGDSPSDEERFSRWLLRHSTASQLISHVFSPLVFEEGKSLLPSTSHSSSLLPHSATMVINMHLPADRRSEWTLLFSSVLYGSSFSQIVAKINGEGPCIVVVTSSNGKTFGCFASAGFLMGPRYHGDATSFLFEVQPQIRIFSATGVTNNYAYLNIQQNTMPNGLGIGGSESTWPFFIYEEYGKGITLPNIRSFEKCHLSGSDTFAISAIEVWRVGEKPRKNSFEDECIRSEKSIIDKDPQTRALLEMTGRTIHSDAYREPAPLLDS